MAVSPGSRLYRSTRRAVILAGLGFILAQIGAAQFARKATVSKGPRALGLVELAASGKARLIPVTILYDGKFYDASAYKATPVPMALESGTVYEALLTGVSQGLFTVASALQMNKTWVGQGSWQSASAIAAAAQKKAAAAKKPTEHPDEPPVLRRPGAEPQPMQPPAPTQAPKQTAPPPAPTPAAAPPPLPAPPPAPEDTNRPVLRRGKPLPLPAEEPSVLTSTAAAPHAAGKTTPAAVQIIPAISDAGGPEPRPYTYEMKPEEEQQFRTKMLALAADEVRARAALLASEKVGVARPSATGKPAPAAKTAQPSFEDVQLRVFDLSSSNEPVLVLTAKARLPQRSNPGGDSGVQLEYLVSLVARDDIYGDLHKALSNVTDTRHMDILPRLELIDAVDADGDSRGELLFRQISEAGSSFVLYRVIGDQLWALFQGTPGK